MGIVYIELFSSTKAWKEIKTVPQMYKKLVKAELPPEIDLTGNYKEIIRRCCCENLRERMTAIELLDFL